MHVFVAFVMIGSILLQSGKGAEIGATFGGSSQTIFGGRGATPFLVKFTVGCAVLFMVTSLFLAILSKGRSVGTSLKLPAAPSATAPPADSSASSGAAPSLPSAEPSGAPPSVPTTPAPVTP
jgi:preprotein translocase subunit SecG